MTKSHNGPGRPQGAGKLTLIQVRINNEEEAARIADLTPRQRAEAMTASSHIERTGKGMAIKLDDPLPCSIMNHDGVCGKPAYFAHADEVNIVGQWPLRGQWLLQPVCADCSAKMAALYR